MHRKQDIRLRLSVYLLLAGFGLFTAARLLLYFWQAAFFASLPGKEIAAAFFNGLRFDGVVLAVCLGSVLLLLNLPLRPRWWVKVWGLVGLSELMVLAVLVAGDLVYFPQVSRHVTDELLHLTNDWGFVISYAVSEKWWVILLLAGVFGLGVWALMRYINLCYRAVPFSWKKTVLVVLIIALATVLGVRGHLGLAKPLGIADVYNYVATPAGAQLALNGVFTMYQISRKKGVEQQNTFPADRAISNAQHLFIRPDETQPDTTYPLMRVSPSAAPGQKKYNVMIVLLEGWHAHYVDAFSHNGYGMTPNFDKIAQEGALFSKAYAMGFRSIIGFAAVFAGVPSIPSLPILGYGLELYPISPMPRLFADNGYYTFYTQTSNRGSFRMCALASFLGAQESYGWEDLPQLLDYRGKPYYGYDYDALMFVADKIKNRPKENFLAMVFTGTTHEPFTDTLPQFAHYPYDTWEHGFLNTLSFADWSIGRLLQRAKQDGWLDNTIFIFVADHVSMYPKAEPLEHHFHIPLVVYAPGLIKPQRIDYPVSQLDIVPTVFRLTGLPVRYTAMGRDLFDDYPNRAAMVSEGSYFGLITKDGSMRHNGSKILSVENYNGKFNTQQAEEQLLSLEQAAYTLLKNNRWYPPQAEEKNDR